MEKVIAEIRQRIDVLLEKQEQVMVAVDGSCASGKTTLAAALAKEYDCNLFHMDNFFLRPEQRTAERLAQPGGNVDYERFREEVLLPLLEEKPFSYRPYDCSTGGLKAPVTVTPKKISIIEGSYSHHPYFGDPYDVKVFLCVSPEIRRQRILARPALLHKKFFEEWIPMEQQYFEVFALEEKADLLAVPTDNR